MCISKPLAFILPSKSRQDMKY